MHYVSINKPLLRSKVLKNMAKLKKLSFCQKVFLWHQTSSCKYSMCPHCVYKVSGCFSKSCGTSWIPHIYIIYAPSRITKGNNSNRIGPSPLIFYYKGISYWYQSICKVWKISIIAFFKILRKKQSVTNRWMDGRTDGNMDVKTVYPHTNTVCRGYKYFTQTTCTSSFLVLLVKCNTLI